MTKRASYLLGTILAGLALGAAPAQAAPNPNLVTNGSFETGSFSGWTETGNNTFDGVQCPGPGPTVSDGNCSAFFGPIGSLGGIQQTLNTLGAGQRYHLFFDFLNDNGTPGSFSVSFGGDTLLALTNPVAGAGAYQSFHLGGVTNGASEILAFNFRDDPGFMFLDNVVLVIPEPATMALLGAGLVGLGFSRRRKAT